MPACPWRPPPGCFSAFIPQVPPPSLYPFRPSPAPWTCGRHSPACLSSSAQACPNNIHACDLCVILALGVGLHAAWCPPPCFAPSPPSPPGFVQGPYAPLCRDAWPQYGGCLHPKLSHPPVFVFSLGSGFLCAWGVGLPPLPAPPPLPPLNHSPSENVPRHAHTHTSFP